MKISFRSRVTRATIDTGIGVNAERMKAGQKWTRSVSFSF